MRASSLMEPTKKPRDTKQARAAKPSLAAEPADEGKPEGVDGRTLRRSRNRAAVLKALIALIQEGDLHVEFLSGARSYLAGRPCGD